MECTQGYVYDLTDSGQEYRLRGKTAHRKIMEPSIQLFRCSEEEFDNAIGNMSVKSLIDTISALQKEMAQEQENFNRLTKRLEAVPDPQSAEHHRVSGQLITSQRRIGELMGRNIKCFSLQSINSQKQGISVETENISNTRSVQKKPQQAKVSQPRKGILKNSNSRKNIIQHNGKIPEERIYDSSQAKRITTMESETVYGKQSYQTINNNNYGENIQNSHDSQKNIPELEDKLSRQRDELDVHRSEAKIVLIPAAPAEEPLLPLSIAVPSIEHSVNYHSPRAGDIQEVTTSTSNMQYEVISSARKPSGGMNGSVAMATSSNTALSQNGRHGSDGIRLEHGNYEESRDSGVESYDHGAVAGNSIQISQLHVAVETKRPVVLTQQSTPVKQSAKSPNHPESSTPNKITFGGDTIFQEVEYPTDLYSPPGKPYNQPDPLTPPSVSPSSSHLYRMRDQPSIQYQPGIPPTPPSKTASSQQPEEAAIRQLSEQPSIRYQLDNRLESHDNSEVYFSIPSPPSSPAKAATTGTTVLLGGPAAGTELATDSSSVQKSPLTTRVTIGPPQSPPVGSMGNKQGAVKTDSHDEGQEVKEEANKVVLLPQNGPVAPPIVPPIDQADGLNIDPADEVVTDRVTMKQWDPSKLLADMYALKLAHDADEEVGSEDVCMEGIMEKLPMNKKKATLLKTWKRRFFRAAEGNLYYFENSQMDKPSSYLQLGGGHIDDLGQRLLGIDDGRGRYLVVRVPHEKDFDNWKRALESQTVDDARRKFVKPVLKSIPNTRKKVVIIDIGSCSIRAGLLGEEASLPQLFFPNIVATDKSTGKKYYGIDAYKPAVRSRCRISYPVRGSSRVDKFTMDTEEMPGLFMKIFTDLKIDPSEYWVLVSVPQNLSMSTQEEFMKVLINKFNVVGVNIHNQSLLSLYSYQAMSGIVIDIGERMEIVPITEGYIVEGGVARQPYGGHKVATVLNSMLTENENKYHFFTDVEFLLVRHVMEKTCYVCEDYKEEVKVYEQNPREFVQNVDLKGYDLPQGTYTNVSHDVSRFKCPEGMFKTDLWGMDVPKIQKQVLKAIQSCPMDFRREMYRSVYLSGGTTLLPGFPERIQREIAKVAPPSVVVQVHASPQRYHAAYIGACTLANLAAFEQASISREEWRKSGPISLKKWQMYWH